ISRARSKVSENTGSVLRIQRADLDEVGVARPLARITVASGDQQEPAVRAADKASTVLRPEQPRIVGIIDDEQPARLLTSKPFPQPIRNVSQFSRWLGS